MTQSDDMLSILPLSSKSGVHNSLTIYTLDYQLSNLSRLAWGTDLLQCLIMMLQRWGDKSKHDIPIANMSLLGSLSTVFSIFRLSWFNCLSKCSKNSPYDQKNNPMRQQNKTNEWNTNWAKHNKFFHITIGKD